MKKEFVKRSIFKKRSDRKNKSGFIGSIYLNLGDHDENSKTPGWRSRWYKIDFFKHESPSPPAFEILLNPKSNTIFRYGGGSVACGSKLYLFGGLVHKGEDAREYRENNCRFLGEYPTIKDIYVYDPTTSTSTSISASFESHNGKMISPRLQPILVPMKNKIYIFGSRGTIDSSFPWAEVFDTEKGTCSPLARPPEALTSANAKLIFHAVVEDNRKIILLIHSGNKLNDELFSYDMTNDSWVTIHEEVEMEKEKDTIHKEVKKEKEPIHIEVKKEKEPIHEEVKKEKDIIEYTKEEEEVEEEEDTIYEEDDEDTIYEEDDEDTIYEEEDVKKLKDRMEYKEEKVHALFQIFDTHGHDHPMPPLRSIQPLHTHVFLDNFLYTYHYACVCAYDFVSNEWLRHPVHGLFDDFHDRHRYHNFQFYDPAPLDGFILSLGHHQLCVGFMENGMEQTMFRCATFTPQLVMDKSTRVTSIKASNVISFTCKLPVRYTFLDAAAITNQTQEFFRDEKNDLVQSSKKFWVKHMKSIVVSLCYVTPQYKSNPRIF